MVVVCYCKSFCSDCSSEGTGNSTWHLAHPNSWEMEGRAHGKPVIMSLREVANVPHACSFLARCDSVSVCLFEGECCEEPLHDTMKEILCGSIASLTTSLQNTLSKEPKNQVVEEVTLSVVIASVASHTKPSTLE